MCVYIASWCHRARCQVAAVRQAGAKAVAAAGDKAGGPEAAAAIRCAAEVQAFAAWPGVAGCATSMVLGRACASNEALKAADVTEAVRVQQQQKRRKCVDIPIPRLPVRFGSCESFF